MLKDPLKKPPKPSQQEVKKYLKLWGSSSDIVLSESSLKKLFTKTYPLNNNLEEIIIKVCSLNELYSLSMYSPITVARHVVSQNIDNDLSKKDVGLVDKISGPVNINGREIKFYAFATKYCSFHKPADYPIYDSYVDKSLQYFRGEYHFENFVGGDLRIYEKFKKVLNKFRTSFGLKKFNLRQIDKYLWLLGKDFFK